MINNDDVKFEAGRTHSMGNYVSASYKGFVVCLYDDRGDSGSISQIKLKEMCLQQLETIFK